MRALLLLRAGNWTGRRNCRSGIWGRDLVLGLGLWGLNDWLGYGIPMIESHVMTVMDDGLVRASMERSGVLCFE